MKKVNVLIQVYGDYCAQHEMSVSVLYYGEDLTEESMYTDEDGDTTSIAELNESSDDTAWLVKGVVDDRGNVYYDI